MIHHEETVAIIEDNYKFITWPKKSDKLATQRDFCFESLKLTLDMVPVDVRKVNSTNPSNATRIISTYKTSVIANTSNIDALSEESLDRNLLVFGAITSQDFEANKINGVHATEPQYTVMMDRFRSSKYYCRIQPKKSATNTLLPMTAPASCRHADSELLTAKRNLVMFLLFQNKRAEFVHQVKPSNVSLFNVALAPPCGMHAEMRLVENCITKTLQECFVRCPIYHGSRYRCFASEIIGGNTQFI